MRKDTLERLWVDIGWVNMTLLNGPSDFLPIGWTEEVNECLHGCCVIYQDLL
jgi:hypothetical protein